ncbi:3-isopropylmalate dehydratase [Marinicauda algicola]|uniref:3-isopropylmalate dehydratase small subunit n=1 Tax=Marinicauda algicola TaxID=2029849 RepID=A0A4S2H3H6_9PROT|nr:3-isopropylmalate dehydratase [Marinicauda algicola]TGY90167.1 3-isopropylmalate dehydratase [Marinicauda algicola]
MSTPDIIRGRAWVFGDRIDTDLLAPGHAMKKGPEALAMHCLEAVDPAFAREVERGDIVVAGEDFGIGSSREQAAISLKLLGVSAVIAKSFARIFYRNAINIGLPAIPLAEAGDIAAGDRLLVDLSKGELVDETTGEEFAFPPLPDHLTAMIEAGGLMAQLKARFNAPEAQP